MKTSILKFDIPFSPRGLWDIIDRIRVIEKVTSFEGDQTNANHFLVTVVHETEEELTAVTKQLLRTGLGRLVDITTV